MQELLKCWKAAGLEQVWESAIFQQKWCKTVLKWSMACLPHSHLTLFTVTDYDMYLLCKVGAGNVANVWAAKQIGQIEGIQWDDQQNKAC